LENALKQVTVIAEQSYLELKGNQCPNEHYYTYQSKGNTMGGTCNTHSKDENYLQNETLLPEQTTRDIIFLIKVN